MDMSATSAEGVWGRGSAASQNFGLTIVHFHAFLRFFKSLQEN